MSLASNLAKLGRLLLAQASGVVNGVSPSAGDSSKALATTEWFKAEQASETTQGTAKVATQVQTNTGIDDTTIVTPKKLRAGFSVSVGTIGFIAFPTWLGGIILQWGQSGTTPIAPGGSASYTFPTAYPNAVAFGLATGAIGNSGIPEVLGLSKTQITLGNPTTGSANTYYYWLSLGW